MKPVVRVEQLDDCTVVTLDGDEAPAWEDIEPLAEPAVAAVGTKGVIYKRNLQIPITTVEISFLLRMHKKAKSQGREICLCEIDDRTRDMLKMTALDLLWEIRPTLDEARAYFASKPQ